MSFVLAPVPPRPDDDAPGSVRESRVASVAGRIIDLIAGGRLAAGDRVAESFLERELGASRYTVREALRVLVTQGVLEKVPHSGCRVTRFDEDRLHQIYLARLQVELLALPSAIAAVAAEPGLLARLDRALERMAVAAEQGIDATYAEADLAFHRAVMRLSGNDIALRLWEILLPHTRIVRAILGGRVDDLAGHVAEHRGLRDTIAARDVGRAADAWRAHMLRHLDRQREAAAVPSANCAAPVRDRPHGIRDGSHRSAAR